MKRFSAFYLLFVGIAIAVLWILILFTEQIEEGPREFGFHLFSEFLLSVLCVSAGLLALRKRPPAGKWSVAAHAMLIYSVLNAAGYYAERDELSFTVMFVFLFLISSVFLISARKY